MATLVHSRIQNKVSVFLNYKYDQFDNTVSSFNLAKHKITIINIYRPPTLSKPEFITQFADFVSKVSDRGGILIICGDFNIDLLQTNSITDSFLKILKSNGLTQIITTPTRGNALLDFIIIPLSFSDFFNTFSPSPLPYFTSDHIPLFLNLRINHRIQTQPYKTTFKDFNSMDLKQLRDGVESSLLTKESVFENQSACESVNVYKSEISRIVNHLCPTKTIIFRHDKSKRWFNSDLQLLKQEKRKFERLCRKSPNNDSHIKHYKKARNAYTVAIKQARINYFSEKIKSSKNDSKSLYKVLNELSGNKKNTVLPSKDDEKETAEKMAQFYVDKVDNIRNKILTENTKKGSISEKAISIQSNSKQLTSLISFKELNIDSIKEIVRNLKKKFCFSDPAPISVVMEFIDLLYPLIQKIVNSSMVEGVFPKELKYAVISPILKGQSLDSEVYQNYRPVSSLPFLSKVLENGIYQQLNTYLQDNELYSSYQSAYRRNHSCETALVKVLDDIQTFQYQNDNNSILILLDQSAAFDTVDHATLLRKLELNFGIKDKALKLIKSYLEDRTFSVKIHNNLSTSQKLKFGVPQGSLLGPIFYILYIHELDQIALKHGFNIHIYADDCQLYTSFSTNNFDNMESTLNKCLTEIKTWMTNNYLMLNSDKTLLKIFWNKKSHLRADHILNVKLSSTVKVLGVNLDNPFNFDNFISNKVRVCNLHLRSIYNIKDSLDTKTRILMVTNLILSTIDYCNVLLLGCTDLALRPLKLIINRSIRIILNLSFRQHISHLYNKLHILPIRKRIIFKACLLAYKIFYRISPSYLQEKCKRFKPTITHMQLREGPGRDVFMFDEKNGEHCKSILTLIKKEWNKLPLSMRKISSISGFKAKLKTHLMFTNLV